MDGVQPPALEHLKQIVAQLERQGFNVTIGG
jgi:hypothetical protein